MLEDGKRYYIVKLDGFGGELPKSQLTIVTALKTDSNRSASDWMLLEEDGTDHIEEWTYWNGEFLEKVKE